MRLRADEEVIARDRALPELAQVLDGHWLNERLADACRETVSDAVVSYVRYKPGVSCLVSGRCVIGATPVPFHAVTLGSSVEKLAGLHRAGGQRLSDHSTAFLFPRDPELRSLPDLFQAELREELLPRLLEGIKLGGTVSLSPVAYKPQRRCVLQLQSDGKPIATLKVYEADRYERARRNSKVMISGSDVRTAARLGRAGSKSVIAFEWLTGRVWVDELDSGRSGTAEALRVGYALAQFHQLGTNQAHRAASFSAPDLTVFCYALSHLGERFAKAASRLCIELQTVNPNRPPNTLCHGDFYPKQVVLSDHDAVGFIDMDDARIGRAEEDMGNCLAHLHRMELKGRITPHMNTATRASLLEGYRRRGGHLDGAVLAHATAHSLLRLAMQPFRDRDEHWPAAIDAILRRATDVLAGARP